MNIQRQRTVREQLLAQLEAARTDPVTVDELVEYGREQQELSEDAELGRDSFPVYMHHIPTPETLCLAWEDECMDYGHNHSPFRSDAGLAAEILRTVRIVTQPKP